MRTGVTTDIGFLHEPGHKEPWYIAMDSKPSEYKTRDYGMRWGIEAMFSDFKSRGFGITDSHIREAGEARKIDPGSVRRPALGRLDRTVA